MSPTTDDLRERLAADLTDFGTLPSVMDRVLLEGRRTRRRRGAAGALLGVVAASAMFAALASDGDRSTSRHDPAASTSPSAHESTTTVTPEVPRLSTEAWNQRAVETLSSLLPARYGGVRLHPGPGSWTLFRTVAGAPKIDFHFEFYSRKGLYGYDLGTCGDDLWWMSSCAYADPPGPWRGRVFHQVVGTDENGSGPVQGEPAAWDYGGGAQLTGPTADVVLGGFSVDDSIPLSLTDEELRTVVEDPAFVALLEDR